MVIQNERKQHNILNSRSEYNRCSLPRLCTQIGDGEYKKIGREIQAEKQEEEKIENKIRQLRKDRNKARLHPTKEAGPASKRRRAEGEGGAVVRSCDMSVSVGLPLSP